MKNHLLLLIFLLSLSLNSKASHIVGGDVLYEHIGGNDYLITIKVFRDCSGISLPSGMSVSMPSSCGSGFINLNFSIVNPTGTYFTQLCPSQLNQSFCYGGTEPGIQMGEFQALSTIQGNCTNYEFEYGNCCQQSLNLQGITGFVSKARFAQNLGSTTDISPVFDANPYPYFTANEPFQYSLQAYDDDGDSLTFAFVDPSTTAAWNPGFSTSYPYPGAAIDAENGEFIGNISTSGLYQYAIEVCSYDRNSGNFKGCVTRSLVFGVVQSNAIPPTAQGGIFNLVGNATQQGASYIHAPIGSQFSFDLHFMPNDTLDSILVESNILNALKGNGSVTFSGKNPVVSTVNVNVTPNLEGMRYLTVFAKNMYCPEFVQSDRVIRFLFGPNVAPATTADAGADQQTCTGTSVALGSNTTNSAQWSVISGDPISVGSNFSCNPCSNPIATPATTTVYQVIDPFHQGSIDTVMVHVFPDVTIQRNFMPDVCLASGNLTLLYTPALYAPGMTYTINPRLNSAQAVITQSGNDGILDVQASGPGSWDLDLTYTDSNGCASTTSDVLVVYPQTPQATFTHIESGTTVDFTNTTFGNHYILNWDFGDGNTSSLSNPQHTYASSGTYPVTLTVGDSCGTTSFTDSVTVNLILSNSSNLDEPRISAFPNPADDQVTLNIGSHLVGSELRIIDIRGALVRRVADLNTLNRITVSDLPDGVYFIQINSGNDHIVQRIIIQH
jgi:hypothetical protein